MPLPPSLLSRAIILSALLFVTGCTEEKALALKNAAIQYSDQVGRALQLSATGIKSSTAMPATTQQDLADEFQNATRPIDAEKLAYLLVRDTGFSNTSDVSTQPLEDLREKIVAFTSIFESLPQGSYLALDEVRRTIPLAIRLNQSLLNLANGIEKGAIRITDNIRRIELIEAHRLAFSLPASTVKVATMQSLAKDVLALSVKEQQMQRQAQVALLQSAELGNSIIGFARDYDKVTIKDILSGLKDTLKLSGRISPETASIGQALTRLNSAAKTWENDPILKPLLDQQIRK